MYRALTPLDRVLRTSRTPPLNLRTPSALQGGGGQGEVGVSESRPDCKGNKS